MTAQTKRLANIGLEVATTAAIVAGVWIYASRSTSPYIPHPDKVLSVFRETWLTSGGKVTADLVPSLERLLAGYFVAAALGVRVGVAIARYPYLRMATEPIVTFLRSTPPPALVPLFIAVFGIESSMKIAVIAFVCLWPILLNTIDGIRSIEPGLVDAARSFGITGPRNLIQVVLPAAAPRIFAGLRISLSISVLILVVSEMVGSTNGLGFYIVNAQQTFAIPEMWSGTILLGLLGVVLNFAFTAVERRAIGWHHQSKSLAR